MSAPQPKSNPSICMLIWHFPPVLGGAELQCLRLSEQLAQRHHNIFVVTSYHPMTESKESLNGINVYGLKSGYETVYNLWQKLRPFIKGNRPKFETIDAFAKTSETKEKPITDLFAKIFLEFIPAVIFSIQAFGVIIYLGIRKKIDIIHVHEAHWIAALGVCAARFTNRKVIVKEAGSGLYRSYNGQPALLKSITKKADCFIAISSEIKKELIESHIPQVRIKSIPNGVAIPDNCWRDHGNLEFTVIFVGNLSQQPWKGIDVLLNGWALCIQQINPAKLLIVGGGDATVLKKQAQELNIQNSVAFLGRSNNVSELLMKSDVFILPSRSEGMSNALLEAMAIGLPCIATNISGNSDLIQNNLNGILIEKENVIELSQALIRFKEDIFFAKQCGQNARETVSKHCSFSVVADDYVGLYHRLLTGKQL